MPSIEVENAALHYAAQGHGANVVFVHGSASDLRTWSSVQAILSGSYRAIAYSRRYHRPNPPIPDGADYEMDEHVRDLAALLARLDLAPAHLVGHSYGAFVALLLAVRSPETVRRLVLCEPPVLTLHVSDPPHLTELLGLALTRPRTALSILGLGMRGMVSATKAARRGDVDGALRSSGRAILGKRALARLSAERLEQARTNTMTAEFLGSGLPPLDERTLRAMHAPTLLMTGDASPPVFHRLSERLGELLPNVQSHTVVGASHLVHEDQPQAFAAAVSAFLSSQQPGCV